MGLTMLSAAGDACDVSVSLRSRLSLCAYASRATPPAMSRKPPIGKRRRPTSISVQPKMRELQRMRCGPGGGMCICGASRLNMLRASPLYEGCAHETQGCTHHVPAWASFRPRRRCLPCGLFIQKVPRHFRGAHVKLSPRPRGLRQPPRRCAPFRRRAQPSKGPSRGRHRSSESQS